MVVVVSQGVRRKIGHRNLKDSAFFRKSFPFFSGLFPDSFRKKAEKTSETGRKKAENFSGRKRNLLSFTLGRKEWLA